LQGFVLQIEVAEIIVHEAGEPNAELLVFRPHPSDFRHALQNVFEFSATWNASLETHLDCGRRRRRYRTAARRSIKITLDADG
jgi:hypothetical protein